ncbi:hypothetical protein cand_000780 [Cryptosporidium andersoni]|uniref:Uncharacterized protein n=1 Tax=Cryptosporidium andersoni TaxID=117008 RepID=A0A1J4MUK8_9CRYT|nr:hypothetical protein cand_000780 [Cryptosporidium andersoni]
MKGNSKHSKDIVGLFDDEECDDIFGNDDNDNEYYTGNFDSEEPHKLSDSRDDLIKEVLGDIKSEKKLSINRRKRPKIERSFFCPESGQDILFSLFSSTFLNFKYYPQIYDEYHELNSLQHLLKIFEQWSFSVYPFNLCLDDFAKLVERASLSGDMQDYRLELIYKYKQSKSLPYNNQEQSEVETKLDGLNIETSSKQFKNQELDFDNENEYPSLLIQDQNNSIDGTNFNYLKNNEKHNVSNLSLSQLELKRNAALLRRQQLLAQRKVDEDVKQAS